MGSVGSSSIGGISVQIRGRNRQYFIDDNNTLRDVQSGQVFPTSENNARQLIQQLQSQGNATVISRAEMNTIRQNRQTERSNRPDYELGNVFNERGRGKTVYRPRRRK